MHGVHEMGVPFPVLDTEADETVEGPTKGGAVADHDSLILHTFLELFATGLQTLQRCEVEVRITRIVYGETELLQFRIHPPGFGIHELSGFTDVVHVFP